MKRLNPYRLEDWGYVFPSRGHKCCRRGITINISTQADTAAIDWKAVVDKVIKPALMGGTR